MRGYFLRAPLLVVVAISYGCAAHRVTPELQSAPDGVTATSLPERVPEPPRTLERYVETVRQLSARARPIAPQAVTVEGQNPILAARLLELGIRPGPNALLSVATEYRRLGVLDVALAYYHRVLRLDPTNAAAFDGLARVWRDWGLPNLAAGDAYRAVFYDPGSAIAHNTFGTVLQAAGDRKGARREYREAARLEASASFAWTNLCYLSFLDGQLVSAAALCKKALALDPASPAAHNNLALVFAAQGNVEAARAELAANGDVADGHFNLGLIYMARKEYELAARAFQEAFTARPTTLAAQRGRQAVSMATRGTGTQFEDEDHDRR